ncbi:hypothetical protein ACJJTC_001198 [Scirpophaga incertulas]
MEKSLKRKIVDAAAAVKKKVRQMRDIETDRAQALETVFKSVTESLNVIATASKQTPFLHSIHEEAKVPLISESLQIKRSENSDDDYASESLHNKGSESSDVDDEGEHESDIHSTSSYESVLEENQDFDTSSWSVYSEALKDIPFGCNQPKGKGLSLIKKWKKDVDYVYWDDPNELVERLKLLIASRDAGNTGLHNEIISIIEELRESKIIK